MSHPQLVLTHYLTCGVGRERRQSSVLQDSILFHCVWWVGACVLPSGFSEREPLYNEYDTNALDEARLIQSFAKKDKSTTSKRKTSAGPWSRKSRRRKDIGLATKKITIEWKIKLGEQPIIATRKQENSEICIPDTLPKRH